MHIFSINKVSKGNSERKKIMFCPYCGTKLDDDAQFCKNCGEAVSNTVHENHKTDKAQQQIFENNPTERKIVYEGYIHKCPNCGEILKSFELQCPACGYELRGVQSASSVNNFIVEISKATSDEQKIALIRNFPISNTKEDIFEFMILATSNFSAENSLYDTGIQKELSDAWYAKFEQCYKKAELLFKDDEAFTKIKKLYDQGQENIIKAKIKENIKSIFTLILRNITVAIGLILTIVAVMIDQAGENSSLVELTGYIVLIASANNLAKRQAEAIDFGICALSGMLVITSSFLLDNGSAGQLCGVIILGVVVFNFFKIKFHKKYRRF